MITLCPSFTGLRASFLKIYQNRLDVNEVNEASEKHSNDEQNAD